MAPSGKFERKKVLLMGKSGAGKTSMRSIIFASWMANDVQRLGVTMDIEHAHVRMLGNLVVNLWDCGGQDTFMENYFINQKEHIFRNAEVLIYVLDVKSDKPEGDMEGYKECLKAIADNSPEAKIFALVHKMDLIEDPEQKQLIFEQKRKQLEDLAREYSLRVEVSKTSIWDKTLYSAWSKIVTQLVPNKEKFEVELEALAEKSGADEVMLFEKATFLNICYKNRKLIEKVNEDIIADRMEDMSHHMKSFKLTCVKNATNYTSVEIKTSTFSAIMSVFTEYTFIMLVSYSPDIPMYIWRENIRRVKPKFDKLDKSGNRR